MHEREWGRIINIGMEGALNWSGGLAEDYVWGSRAETEEANIP
jgi:hypothetical protein